MCKLAKFRTRVFGRLRTCKQYTLIQVADVDVVVIVVVVVVIVVVVVVFVVLAW